MKKILLSIIMIMLIILLIGCKPFDSDKAEYKYTLTGVDIFITKEIVSLNSVYKTEGNLNGNVSGGIKDIPYYVVYVKESENEYVAFEYDASRTSLVETNSTPHIKEGVKSVIVDKESLRGSTMGDIFKTYIDNNTLSHVMPVREDIYLNAKINDKILNLPISYSRFSVGRQVYSSIDIEKLDEVTKNTLIDIFPDLENENKTLLISIEGNNCTLLIPEGTIANDFNVQF